MWIAKGALVIIVTDKSLKFCDAPPIEMGHLCSVPLVLVWLCD